MNTPHAASPALLKSRRSFIQLGAASAAGLTLGFHLPVMAQKGAGSVSQEAVDINAWIRITPNNLVVCEVARAEMGQGTSTSLPMMLAEELECNWADVRMEFASVSEHLARNKVYVTFATGGSRGTRDSQAVMRKAGAVAREMLKAAAAQEWGVPVADCVAKAGRISHRASQRSLTYGALAAKAAQQPVPTSVRLKAPSEWTLIGQPIPRLDIPAKVDGSAVFGIDVRLPGMLYAAIMQCPVFGGSPATVDDTAVKNRRGVKKVVTGPDFVAVVADNWWRAQQAVKALKVAWDYKGQDKLDDLAVFKLLEAGTQAARPLRQDGDFAKALAEVGAGKVVEAEYFVPYLSHFTLEPQNCTAQVTGDRVEVWAPTQNAEATLAVAAKTAGVPPQNVKVNRPYLGGGFGRRGGFQDFVRQSVQIAQALPGVPVKLLWTREEDMQHDFYRPAALYRQRAVLDAQGQLVAWEAKLASQSILAAIRPESLKNGQDFQAGESFHDMPYQVAHLDVRHGMCDINVPVGFWRSVFHSQNPFARECFLDEVLASAGKDPLQGRLDLLPADSRDRLVLQAVAKAAAWGRAPAKGRVRGLAVQDAYGSYAAAVVELSVSAQKVVTVHKVWVAVDPGQVANIDSAKAQIEGNVVYALSTMFLSEINVRDGRVQQANLGDYPLMQLRQVPQIIPILVPTGAEVWGGMGEPPYAPLTAAVANAIAKATGERLRRNPFSHAGYNLA
ncbi:molybdopterin-dependent oxidoreductase [Curvibacter sp. HBC28]|uniref:Molybdopterin-dependent oxidoreductase n=1 Tax=Curvibacter microcysteis TaxID=3026419 RepID=A0ABT5MDV6_9BURK|nr:molybdopterin cofactor-binding domain-containing protein [Curvibacter sp. HBC28]MDD0814768.1 molybdopterin-dependent oxidoreductase [Curvibacter sp. HBC28]